MWYRVKGKRPDGSCQLNVLQQAYSPDQAIRWVKKTTLLSIDTIQSLQWEAEEVSVPTK